MHLPFEAQQQTTQTIRKHKKSHLCLIVANFSGSSSNSTFIRGKNEGGNKLISHMTQLLTKHGLGRINIQAREVRKIVQSALWLVR